MNLAALSEGSAAVLKIDEPTITGTSRVTTRP